MDRISSRKLRVPRTTALIVAEELQKKCTFHTVICGSLRRGTPYVNDIDIAVYYNQPDFASVITKSLGVELIRGGSKNATFMFKGIQVNAYRYERRYAEAVC